MKTFNNVKFQEKYWQIQCYWLLHLGRNNRNVQVIKKIYFFKDDELCGVPFKRFFSQNSGY